MKVRDFFENYNPQRSEETNLYMHDITTNSARHDNLASFLNNIELHTDWKNAKILGWCITGNEIVLTVEKEA